MVGEREGEGVPGGDADRLAGQVTAVRPGLDRTTAEVEEVAAAVSFTLRTGPEPRFFSAAATSWPAGSTYPFGAVPESLAVPP